MGESFLCRFNPVVCWFLIGDAEFCSKAEEDFGCSRYGGVVGEVVEGEFGWSSLVFVEELGGKDDNDVLSFCFCCVGGESVLSDESCVVFLVFEEGVLVDGSEGVGVEFCYLLCVFGRRLLLCLLLCLLLGYRELDLSRESLRSSLLVSCLLYTSDAADE